VKTRYRVATVVAAACAALVSTAAAAPVPLDSFNVDINKTSVSGISSGGYMATQFHVAFSGIVVGAGIVASGPFYCAQGSVLIALTACTTPTVLNPPDVANSIRVTDQYAAQGVIDATANLADTKVWMFSGTKDETVYPVVVDALAEYYRHYVPNANIFYEKTIPAAHAMITDGYGFPCNYKGNGDNPGDTFINDCKYDAAGKILAHIYGPLNAPATALSGYFHEFPQDEFIADPVSHSMNPTGVAYIPADCDDGAKCRVHVAFHGCRQQPARIGDVFYRNVGYNRWADTNRTIVLYPQTINSDLPPVYNPRGCWDWWGYDDPNYANKGGRQMIAVKGMIDRLAAGIRPTPPLPPDNVRAIAVTNDSVSLDWDASPSPRVVGYDVYRSGHPGGPFVKVNASRVDATGYTANGLQSGTTYYFLVRALDRRGRVSADSNQASATTGGLPPLLSIVK